ncbi:hypothetical protein ACHAW6_001638 [Cyclotella cf. meneghiniana]
MSITGNSSWHQCANAIISASIVERAISVCSLDTHTIGQSDTEIKKPVQLFAHAGSSASSFLYNPAG